MTKDDTFSSLDDVIARPAVRMESVSVDHPHQQRITTRLMFSHDRLLRQEENGHLRVTVPFRLVPSIGRREHVGPSEIKKDEVILLKIAGDDGEENRDLDESDVNQTTQPPSTCKQHFWLLFFIALRFMRNNISGPGRQFDTMIVNSIRLPVSAAQGPHRR